MPDWKWNITNAARATVLRANRSALFMIMFSVAGVAKWVL